MRHMWTGAAVVLGVTLAVAGNVRAAVSQEPTAVIKGDRGCAIPGANANGDMTFGGLGTATIKLENNNKVMLKCTGEGIKNLTGQAQSFKGWRCGFEMPGGPFVVTEDSHATVSASGVGTATCTYAKP